MQMTAARSEEWVLVNAVVMHHNHYEAYLKPGEKLDMKSEVPKRLEFLCLSSNASLRICSVTYDLEVISSIQVVPGNMIYTLLKVENSQLESKSLHAFNAHSVYELKMKLDLEGFIFSDPSIDAQVTV